MFFTSANALVFADIDDKDASQATAISAVSQQISVALGVAVGGGVLEAAAYFSGQADRPACLFGRLPDHRRDYGPVGVLILRARTGCRQFGIGSPEARQERTAAGRVSHLDEHRLPFLSIGFSPKSVPTFGYGALSAALEVLGQQVKLDRLVPRGRRLDVVDRTEIALQ